MKVIIWILVILVAGVVQAFLRVLLQQHVLPIIPGSVIIWIVAYKIARHLCDSWDYNHSKGKYAPIAPATPEQEKSESTSDDKYDEPTSSKSKALRYVLIILIVLAVLFGGYLVYQHIGKESRSGSNQDSSAHQNSSTALQVTALPSEESVALETPGVINNSFSAATDSIELSADNIEQYFNIALEESEQQDGRLVLSYNISPKEKSYAGREHSSSDIVIEYTIDVYESHNTSNIVTHKDYSIIISKKKDYTKTGEIKINLPSTIKEAVYWHYTIGSCTGHIGK